MNFIEEPDEWTSTYNHVIIIPNDESDPDVALCKK